MASVPMEYGLVLAAILFVLGLIGVLVRRNVLFILLSVEIMLNAVGLAFMAAAEVSVGLALLLQLYRTLRTLDADAADEMRG
jgi:NADH-quinone oxidoreductase subunit K